MLLNIQKYSQELLILNWGVVIEIALLLFRFFTRMDRTNPLTTILFYVPFVLFCLAYIHLTKMKIMRFKLSSALILFFSFLFSITHILDAPNLSDDLYRYYWDGKVSFSGINPYSFAPDSPNLSHLRDDYWLFINNKDLTTPYPPFIIALCALLYLLSPSIYSFKVLSVVSYFLSSVILILMLRRYSRSPYYSLIYTWNPLMAIEFGHSGHNDSVAVFFMLLSTFFLSAKQYKYSALTLGVATLSKIFPALLTPFYIIKWRLKGMIVYISVVILPYIPLSLIGSVQTSLVTYFERIAFNAGFYYLLEAIISYFIKENAALYARITITILFSVCLVYMTYKFREKDFLFNAYLIIAVYLLLTPTVHPWYLSWILPFAALYAPEPWLYFSGAIFLSYYTYSLPEISPGFWPEQVWVRAVEYIPFMFLLLLSLRKELSGANRG